MNEKPEALRLAHELDAYHNAPHHKLAAIELRCQHYELRRLHAENERLREELKEDTGVIAVWRGRTERAEAENERLQNLLYEMLGELTALRAEKQMRDQIAALRREDV